MKGRFPDAQRVHRRPLTRGTDADLSRQSLSYDGLVLEEICVSYN